MPILNTRKSTLSKRRSHMLNIAMGSIVLLSIPVISIVGASMWMSAKYWNVDNAFVTQWWTLAGLSEIWALPQLMAVLNLVISALTEIKDQESADKAKEHLSKWLNIQWMYLTMECLYAIGFIYTHYFHWELIQGSSIEAQTHGICGLMFVYACMIIRTGLIVFSKNFNIIFHEDKACQTDEIEKQLYDV